MQIAIISDIHGNSVALEAVLADLRHHPTDQVVCLGDAIQGGPQPAQVVTQLRQLACPVVMGNADAWLLTGEESGQEQNPAERQRQMQAIRAWSLSQLTTSDRAFIAGFQPTIEIPLAGRRLLCFHGSPTSFDDVILPQTAEEAFQGYLGPYTEYVLTGGHTHLQYVRRLENTFFFNPGSVGLAYYHEQSEDDFRLDPWAEYAVLRVDEARISLEFRRILFDVAEVIRAYRDSGRPYANEAIAQYGSR